MAKKSKKTKRGTPARKKKGKVMPAKKKKNRRQSPRPFFRLCHRATSPEFCSTERQEAPFEECDRAAG